MSFWAPASLSFSACHCAVSSAERCSSSASSPCEALEPVARGVVALLLERLALDLELDDAAVELVDLLGLRLCLHAQPRRRLVHQVDRLVRQEAVGDVAVRQRRRGDDARRR